MFLLWFATSLKLASHQDFYNWERALPPLGGLEALFINTLTSESNCLLSIFILSYYHLSPRKANTLAWFYFSLFIYLIDIFWTVDLTTISELLLAPLLLDAPFWILFLFLTVPVWVANMSTCLSKKIFIALSHLKDILISYKKSRCKVLLCIIKSLLNLVLL